MGLTKNIKFNGLNSSDYGIQVETPPEYTAPEKDYEIVHVPGKNGDVFIDKGSYKNVERSYKISFGKINGDFTTMAQNLINWLRSTSGYARLEDDYEPDYFRIAQCSQSLSVENILNQGGKTTISFDCKPQRFLKSGETSKRYNATSSDLTNRYSGKITNNTSFPASPIITAYANITYSGLINFGTAYIESISKPSKWNTTYTNYYTRSGESPNYVFTQVPSGIEYSLVTYNETYLVNHNQPANWATTYMNYYTRSGEEGSYVYTKVPLAEDVPTFEDEKYYTRHVEPLDWGSSYTSYYTRSGESPDYIYTPVPEGENAPVWENNMYYTKNETIPVWIEHTYYSKQTEPSDWKTNYTDYYTRSAAKPYVYTQVTTLPEAWEDNKYCKRNAKSGSIIIGDYIINVLDMKGIDSETGLCAITIDCDLQDAYYGTENLNLDIETPNGFIKIVPGENNFSFTGNIKRIEVTPRWWTL